MGECGMFKLVSESISSSNKYGKCNRIEHVILSKPEAIKRAATIAQHNCVEVFDSAGQLIAVGDPIIGLKEVV